MRRLCTRLGGLLLAGLLTACSSTMPQSASSSRPGALPTVTPEQPGQQDGTGSAGAPPRATPTAAPTPTPGDGPATATMQKLQIDGERYAALGDPNAPITVVEFSDYG